MADAPTARKWNDIMAGTAGYKGRRFGDLTGTLAVARSGVRSWIALGVTAVFGCVACSAGGEGAESFCDRIQDCAEKAGVQFSVTSCKSDFVESKESAGTAGCSDEYEEYVGCVSNAPFVCSDDLDLVVEAECGSKAKALSECLGPGTEVTGVGANACDRAQAKIDAKIDSCGGTVPTPYDPEERKSECTEERAKRATEAAEGFEALPCERVLVLYPGRI